MRLADYVINLVLSGVLIFGAYQFHFWCQRNAPFEAREFESSIDDLIPCRFPSMHTSVAMPTALHLYDRHGVVDIPAGAALGWFAHALYVALIAS